MTRHPYLPFLLLWLIALLTPAGAEPLVEGRVRLDSGQPAAGAQVLLFDLADLRSPPVAAMTDERGWFALPSAAFPGRAVPERFELGANYPNPFNPSTIIPYQLPAPMHVRLAVFNVLGQRIATLVDGARPAGSHTATWEATDAGGRAVAAGVYLYRLSGSGRHMTRRMVLIDGQAGVAVAVPGGSASAGAESPEADKVYGLTVSGEGLATYVDPAFRAEAGMAPLDIVVETPRGLPRAKVAAAAILGDVDNNGRVDIFDALLIAVYSANPALVMPNNGDISLGDINRDGRTDLTDAYHVATYTVNPSDPTLPAGIGQAYTQQPPQPPPTGTAASKLYWSDWGTDKIHRADLNGSNVEDLVTTGLNGPDGLSLDLAGGKIYWADAGTNKIQRSNLDGSGVEDLVTGLGIPYGLALDVSGGKMYWTTRQTNKIQRSNLGGSGVEDLVTSGLTFPGALALDVSGGKMYWTNPGARKIQRSNLSGSSVEDLVTSGLSSPTGLALDVAGGKMYWTDRGTDKIQRSNLSGASVEDLVTSGLNSPNGLALDVAGGKMYWADAGTDKVQRANLNGSGVEDLLTSADGLVDPSGMALGFGTDSQSGAGPAQATASLSPLPSTVSFLDDGAWHRFTVQASVPVVVVANPGGTTPRVEINNLSNTNYCPPEANDDLTRQDGQTLVLAGCSPGTGTVELRRASDQTVLQTYTFTIQTQGTGGGGGGNAPDLIVEAPTVSSSSPTAGASFTLRATVRNQGSGRSDSTTLRYYRSTDATVSTSDTEIGTDYVSSLSASRTSAESISLTAPSAGTYYYGACVESVSGEGNTGNNCSIAVTVTVGAGPMPDLIVEAPTVSSSSPTAGASFRLSATVRNQGSGQSASTTLRWYRSTDATVSTSDTEVGTDYVSRLSASRTSAESISLTAPSAGTYYYGACVESVSGESNTGNNCSSAVTVTVGAAPAPDLIVDAPTVSSSSPAAGASFTLRATVRNQGSGRSASTTLRYYRSTDATVSTSDTEIGTDYVSSLSASRTSAEWISLRAPSSAGTYYYGACVESVSGESNTGNNCSSAVTVTVGAAPAPDLIVDAPTVSSSSPTAGASFTLSATVRNQGNGQSASTTLRWYRSTDATVSTSDTEVGTDYVSSLSASRTSAESIGLRAPSSAGTYYYGACVESVSGESNTGNNCSSAVTVTVGAAPAPDLIVDAPTVSSSSPAAGASFTLNATVRNQGNVQSPATTLRYYRSSDATISSSDTQVGTGSVPVLPVGIGFALSTTPTAPSSAGTYYYGACVESVSGESDTGNNCSSAVTVTVAETTTEEPETPPAGASKLYWSDWGTDKIHRADLDGSNVEDLVSGAGLDGPDGLSLDLAGGKIYWADAGTNKIQRANLDGSGAEDLVTGLGIPYGLALDVAGGKMYWTTRQTNKIQRANLDGSGVEDLVTSGLTFPGGLALDVSGGKMYWTNPGARKIQRSNLSGSSVEDLVTSGLSSPTGLALDVAGGKMYWTDRGTDKIQRSNLSGTNVEDLVTTGLDTPNGLALDVAGGKMYWADAGTDKVQRANLNGSGVEDLLTGTDGLIDPSGIALGGTTQTGGGGGGGTGPAPDLIVEAPTVSDGSPTVGASFTLRATVRNQGSGRSASTTLRWYRSTDATVSTSDTEIGTDAVSVLDASRTGAESISLTAPSSPGTYYYGACVESVSGESDTGNNCSSAVTVTVGAAPAPDLVVDAPTVSNSSPTAGASFTLRATVRNQGDGRSASTTLRYYRSTDATVSTGDTEVGTDGVSVLDPSRTGAESISLTAPSSVGTYYYGACVESVSDETDTGNNCSAAVTVTVGAAPAPDLVVVSPSVSSSSPTVGASFTLNATVRNQGNGASAATTLRFYRSSDATISTGDTEEAGSHHVGGLAASGTSDHSTDLTAPSNAGTYYYGACVESVSDESDTGNNCSSAVTVTVGAAPTPDLVVGTPRANPSTPTAGASFILSATVENQGSGQSASTTLRFYRSTDAAISTSDTQEPGSHPVGGLAASGTSDHSANLTAPSSAGTYYYGACVESASGESDTGNNCSSAVAVTVAETTPAGASKLYWSDWGTDKIQRADLDGSNVEDLVSGAGLNGPDGLSLDLAGGKIYWADAGTNKIQRANLDGSGVEDLVTGLGIPYGLGLDVAGGKMYWTNRQTGKIQGANLDGSGVEDLVTSGLTFPGALALDVAGGKMYWTNPGATKIQRADLSGSGVEDLVTSGLSSPLGLALDVAGGKIYWTDRGADKIQRADLSGSNVEDLVTSGLNSPNGLALDVTGGKMYWTDEGTNKVQRANLNGSGVEDLLTSSDGLVDPSGIALGGESASSSNGGSNTYGVGDALPDVPTGFFVPTRLAGGASLASSGGTTTITFDNGGQMELQNGTTYTCIASGGCTVENGRVTMGLFE